MFSLVPILVNEQKNGMRFVRRQLRDTLNPYVIPEERFYEMYRMPPTLAIKLTNEFRPYVDDTDDIPLHLQVLSLLNFYASGSYQRRVGSDALCCISQSKVSQIIEKLSYVGYANLSGTFIQFPTSDDEVRNTKERFQLKYNFPGIIGIIKGVHFYAAFKKPIDTIYLNRKGTVSINTQVICNADLVITFISTRSPGSSQDSAVWMSSHVFSHFETKFAAGELDNTWLLGDTGFPLQPFLLVPVLIPDNVHEEVYNKVHRKIRKLSERCLGYMKGRFKCLTRERKLKLSHVEAGHVITTCAVLQNFLIGNGFDITDLPMIQEDVPTEPLRHQSDMYMIGTNVRKNVIGMMEKSYKYQNCTNALSENKVYVHRLQNL